MMTHAIRGGLIGLVIGALIIFWGHNAHADSVNIGFGPSMDGDTNPKYGSIEVEKDWGDFALVGNLTGIFAGPAFAVVSIIPSIKVVTPSGLFLRGGVGPAYTTQVNDRLSSPAQINIEMAGGLWNPMGEVGVKGDHWSNGSIVGGGPNLGADTLQAYLGVHF